MSSFLVKKLDILEYRFEFDFTLCQPCALSLAASRRRASVNLIGLCPSRSAMTSWGNRPFIEIRLLSPAFCQQFLKL